MTAGNPWYGGDAETTQDEIFLLSLDEVVKYADFIGAGVGASPKLKKSGIPALPGRLKPSTDKYDKYESFLTYQQDPGKSSFYPDSIAVKRYKNKSKLTAMVNMPITAQLRWSEEHKRSSNPRKIYDMYGAIHTLRITIAIHNHQIFQKSARERADTWMLRTKGFCKGRRNDVVVVEPNGRINLRGLDITSENPRKNGLRPAFWTKL